MKHLITILCFVFIFGCTKQEAAPAPAPAPEQEKPAATEEKPTAEAPAASGSIALVYEKTGYKEKLINEMKSLLEKDGFKVQVLLHSEKAGVPVENPGDFTKIFITISGVNSTVRPWVADWLKKNAGIKNNIILHVTQTHDWKVNADVDTITGASKDEAKAKAAEYVKKLKEKSVPAE